MHLKVYIHRVVLPSRAESALDRDAFYEVPFREALLAGLRGAVSAVGVGVGAHQQIHGLEIRADSGTDRDVGRCLADALRGLPQLANGRSSR